MIQNVELLTICAILVILGLVYGVVRLLAYRSMRNHLSDKYYQQSLYLCQLSTDQLNHSFETTNTDVWELYHGFITSNINIIYRNLEHCIKKRHQVLDIEASLNKLETKLKICEDYHTQLKNIPVTDEELHE